MSKAIAFKYPKSLFNSRNLYSSFRRSEPKQAHPDIKVPFIERENLSIEVKNLKPLSAPNYHLLEWNVHPEGDLIKSGSLNLLRRTESEKESVFPTPIEKKVILEKLNSSNILPKRFLRVNKVSQFPLIFSPRGDKLSRRDKEDEKLEFEPKNVRELKLLQLQSDYSMNNSKTPVIFKSILLPATNSKIDNKQIKNLQRLNLNSNNCEPEKVLKDVFQHQLKRYIKLPHEKEMKRLFNEARNFIHNELFSSICMVKLCVNRRVSPYGNPLVPFSKKHTDL